MDIILNIQDKLTSKNENHSFIEKSSNSFFQKAYWLNKLSGELPETNLIPDYVRPVEYNSKKQFRNFELSDDLAEAIIKFTKGSHLAIYLLLVSALSILLHKYTGNSDVVLGSPIYQQGNYDNCNNQVVPLRLNVRNQLTFKDLLIQVKNTAIAAYVNQNYPFNELAKLLNLPQLNNRCQLFDIVALLENIHEGKDISVLNNDITISFVVDQNTIKGKVEYDQALFQDETIQLIIRYYINLLEEVLQNINLKISDIDLLKEADKQQLLKTFNDNTKNYPIDRTIYSLFEEQVSQNPHKIAVVDGENHLTYQELNDKANQLARFLRKLGLNRGEFVGILKDRDINFLIAILAIFKAGGAYVPIDNNYPPDRIKYMLSNSEVRILLTDSLCLDSLIDLIEDCHHLESLIYLDTKRNINTLKINIYDKTDFDNLLKENLAEINQGIDPAYMLYTSGSTGLPKGAIVRHDGAINHIYAQFDELKLTEDFCFLQSAPSSTDISVWQFLAPLLIGGKTVIVDLETACIPEKLLPALQENRVTVVELVPAVFNGLLDYVSEIPTSQRLLSDLKWMMVVGEPVAVKRVNQWLSIYPSIPVANAYGPTEAADDITQFIVEKPFLENQRTVPIGKPLANLNLYILDSQMRLLPIGVPGEICVSGIGVGDGYWKNEEKTKSYFVPNPFPDNRKTLPESNRDLIYKTGDLGRWLPDGNIEFLGRIDNQVKIRGFRIELGEIEARLSQHSSVRENVVVVKEDSSDDKYLVAYVVAIAHQTINNELVTQLRNFLQEKLPQYMMPSAFVLLDNLPIAPSGKIDRLALPAPDWKLQNKGIFVAPSTPVEEMLAGIWAEVLKLEQVGIHDNFFELGGHSLLATRVISQMRQVFQVELPLRGLFEKPTIAQFAKDIEKATKAGLGLEAPPINRISQDGELPLSFGQQRLWFLSQLEPDNPFYNLSAAIHLQGQLNLIALEQTFNQILHRHQPLRTNFQIVAGQPTAVISPITSLTLALIDLSELPQNQQQIQVKQLTSQEAQQPFNLNTDILLRAKLLRLTQQEHILLLTLHHIAADGWSIGIMIGEMATLYQAYCNEQPSLRDATRTPLAELPIQYSDFAAWQRQWLQGKVLQSQMSYWQKQLKDAPFILELPTDKPRPPVQTYRGASHTLELASELSKALNQLSQKTGSTLFMTLLAAFKILLGRYTGSEDIVVGSAIANRNRAEIEGLIGFFVNTLVLRTDLANNPTFTQLLERVREVALGAYAHQDLPFEQLVEELHPQRSLSHTPLFQVMFVLQNAPMSKMQLPGLILSPVKSDSGTAQFDLTLSMEETVQGLLATFEYNTDLFEPATIERMAGHFQTLLEGIIANPEEKIWDLPLLTNTERHQILVEWNNTQVDYPNQCIHELFEAQVEKTPDAIAVVFENQQLTYRELNARANQLAHHLQKLGVKPDVLVGICVERSLDMIVGLLGILKAGGAYVPLDPAYPTERKAFMLSDSQVSVLLTQTHLTETLPPHQAQVICLDTDWGASQSNPTSEVNHNHLAYVIYTSGTTGIPKGVAIAHRSPVILIHWAQSVYSKSQLAGVLAATSICFDLSVFEIFVPLSWGGCVILAENALALPKLTAAQQVTLLNTVPSAARELLRLGGIPPSVQTVNLAGEALQQSLVQQLYQQSTIKQVFNLYGPSEDTTYSTYIQVPNAASTPTIGKAIANTQIYLLDSEGQPVPIGVPGELHIGGDGLARGYLSRPQLTTEKFIPNPFSQQPGAKLYKTGDLARYLPNGEIEYIGRIDYQVKIRGFRIELGEIEAVLSQHPQVRETVVVAWDNIHGEKHLVAYVASEQQTISVSELRNFLKKKLPEYMIPAVFLQLAALPLTPNGKLDRRKLPIPENLRPELEVAYVMPQTELERTIANTWQQVLNVENIGIHDNFFDLGGHSLLMVKVNSQLHEVIKTDLSMLDMFRYPTINSLAEYLSKNKNQTSSCHPNDIPIEKINTGKAQQRKRLQKIKFIENNKGVEQS